MTWFFAFLVVVVMGVVAVVASGRGGSMAETYDDRPDSRVQADGPLTAADLRSVRFSTAFRGYRMSEVDSLLDRLAAEMTPVAKAGTIAAETVPDDAASEAAGSEVSEAGEPGSEEPGSGETGAEGSGTHRPEVTRTTAAADGAAQSDQPRADEPVDTAAPPAKTVETEATDAPLPDGPRHRGSLQPDERRR